MYALSRRFAPGLVVILCLLCFFYEERKAMEYFNLGLYLLWSVSSLCMLGVAFYGYFRCNMDSLDFLVVLFVAFIPMINTVILFMLILFSVTGALRRNGFNQY